jgi:hypothetical protein
VRERLLKLVDDEQFRVRRLVARPPGAHPLGAPPAVEAEGTDDERGHHGRW